MSLTGLPLLVLAIIGAVVLPVIAVATWRYRRLRVTRTATALVLSQLLVAVSLGLAINRQQLFFASWTDLMGASQHAPVATQVRAGRLDHVVQQAAQRNGGNGGVVIPITVHGASSGITLPADVYLPATYNSAAGADERFPVIEVLDGFPGSPQSWLGSLRLKQVLDEEIASGRMAPTIAVLPFQNITRWRDSECVNAVHGPQLATFLTTDLQRVISGELRVAAGRHGWGLIGYSTGGFCAANLALQHPYSYAAAASLSGYFSPFVDVSTGNLYHGSRTAWDDNDPIWIVQHRRLPGLAFYLAASRVDLDATRSLHAFTRVAKTPLETTVTLLPTGGHNFDTWRALETPALDWLAGHLLPPLAAPQTVVAPPPRPLHHPAITAQRHEAAKPATHR